MQTYNHMSHGFVYRWFHYYSKKINGDGQNCLTAVVLPTATVLRSR